MALFHLEERYKQLQLATSFLTRFPVRQISAPIPQLHDSFWAFAVVGMVLGAIYAAVMWIGHLLGVPTLLLAIVAISLGLLCTGALHEDGFADMLDGFGGGKTAEDKLRIMKDSLLGSFGVSGLILLLFMRVVSLEIITEQNFAAGGSDAGLRLLLILGVIAGCSRMCMIAILAFVPAARADGLGQSFSTQKQQMTKGVLVGMLVVLMASFFVPAAVLIIFALMGCAAYGVAWLCRRQIGGQTGDICGATQVMTETAGWFMLTVIPLF